MKKSNLFFMMAAGAMLATSCASEQEMPEVPGSNDAGKQLIYLSVANDNGNTRAGRPLTDGAAAQDIENVKLILVKGNTVVWAKTINNWNNGGSEIYANGRQAVVEIEKGEGENQYTLSSDDNCTLYAIGYSNGTDYKGLDSTVAGYKKGDKFDKNITLEYTGSTGFAEEIFAGEKTGLKGGDNGVKAELVLNRQVAGTYGYMNEIPYVENDGNVARYLTLVASDQNATIALGQFDNKDHVNGGKSDYYVVNTLPGNGETVIYTIDLKDWFGELEEDVNIPGQLSTENWKNATKGTKASSYVQKGAVFAGAFIHPFRSTGSNTFKLYLSATEDYKQDSNAMSWNITLPNGPQLNTNGYNFSSLGENGFSAFTNYSGDNKYVYNVLRNHLYSIGVKPATKPVDPDKPVDPENPDPDPEPEPGPDDPTPLNNKQEITLKVNSCWEVIHNMGLE